MSTGRCDATDARAQDAANGTRHEEWLMDEAIRDSFPASDPASSSQPGSIAYERYAAHYSAPG